MYPRTHTDMGGLLGETSNLLAPRSYCSNSKTPHRGNPCPARKAEARPISQKATARAAEGGGEEEELDRAAPRPTRPLRPAPHAHTTHAKLHAQHQHQHHTRPTLLPTARAPPHAQHRTHRTCPLHTPQAQAHTPNGPQHQAVRVPLPLPHPAGHTGTARGLQARRGDSERRQGTGRRTCTHRARSAARRMRRTLPHAPHTPHTGCTHHPRTPRRAPHAQRNVLNVQGQAPLVEGALGHLVTQGVHPAWRPPLPSRSSSATYTMKQ